MNTRSNKTTCPYCGVGCGVILNQPADGASPCPPVTGDKSHPANFGRLCVKGSALADTLSSDDRLLQPKVNGEATSWDAATDFISNKIKEVISKHGPDAFSFYLSGQLLTEDYYVANKLAKGFIGTANVDTNSRLCMASAVVGYKRAFGSDTVPCNYEDLENCDLLIMIGSNAAWTHPVLYQRIVAAKAIRPQMKIVVIDPRKTASCDIADLHLPLKPGSDAAIFSFLLQNTAAEGQLDKRFITEHTNGFTDTLKQAELATPNAKVTAEFCDLDEADLNTLATWWRDTPRTVSFYSQGVNQSSSGVDKCNAIINCHLATGRIGKEGAGPLSITGQPNAMGGREVGGLANQLAAHMDFKTPNAIATVQEFWQAPNMAQADGLKAVDLFQAIESGKVKVVWIMSTNPMVSLPDTAQIKRALEKCELVIVSDCKAHTDTTAMAQVLLPATGWSEKDGTVTNSERCISRQRGLIIPPGNAKHDWWAICEVAKKLGFDAAFNYAGPHEIFAEHAALSDFKNNGERDFNIGEFANISKVEYDNFDPIRWPVPKGKASGTARMFTDGQFYTPDKRARFIPIQPSLPADTGNTDYPYLLNTGRMRDQWHTMTRTGDAASLLLHTEQPFVDINPQDAKALNIADKTLVRISSKLGEVILKAKINSDTPRKNLFVPIHWTQQFANAAVVSRLIPQVVDKLSGQPESKHAQVTLEAVENINYGVVVSAVKQQFPTALYWCLIPSVFGYKYEVVWPKGISLAALKDKLLNDAALESKAEWLEYENPITGQIRLALVQSQQLQVAVYSSEAPESVFSAWLTEKLDPNSKLQPADRIALLAGTPANVIDKGEIICSCFQVGSKQIEAAIEAGDTSAEQLGVRLKCGTNCGSCIPELKQALALAVPA